MNKDVSMKPYSKKFQHSYTFGVFPTIELLENQPGKVLKILLHSHGKQNKGQKMIIDLCRRNNIKTEWADGLINKLSESRNTYAVGVFEKYQSNLDKINNHLVLVSPEDTGNLGSILRSCLAFGIKDIAIIKPAVDIFDPRVVRASMGAIFKIRFSYFDDIGKYTNTYSHKIYPFVLRGTTELSDTSFESPFALVFGGESSGLPAEFEKTENTVNIRQSRDVDSLNLSTAVSLALYRTLESNEN